MGSDHAGRAVRAIALALACIAGATGVAAADIDPASDVLLQQNSFVPYQAVCTQEKDALRAATDRAKAAGYQLKVAVIASQADLGGAPEFFGHPAPYTNFLGRELVAFGRHGRVKNELHLVTLMPQGWGLYQVDPRAKPVVEAIRIPSGADANALTRAAIRAVPQIATAAGHPTGAVKIPPGCSHKRGTPVLVFMAPFLLVVGGLAAHYLLQRRRNAGGD